MKYENRRRVENLVKQIEYLERCLDAVEKTISHRGNYSAEIIVYENSNKVDSSRLVGEDLKLFVDRRVSNLKA